MTRDLAPFPAKEVLRWFDQHGRHDLPWQQDTTPYRVWVSEIMLQQTQVSTVIPYYQRFMARLPTVQALAEAPIDDVLQLWTGLGYYARARNLHKTAQHVVESHNGVFPDTLEGLTSLPGIGRSTAGAILALSMSQRGVILDGNVKRVLCRFYGIDQWAGTTEVQKQLWQLAEEATPDDRVAAYTQAMMDLGATVCTRSRPQCLICPLHKNCLARLQSRTADIPAPRPRREMPQKHLHLLICTNARGDILLQQRPGTGIWGGLWSFPEFESEVQLSDWLQSQGGTTTTQWPVVRHSFSHYHLHMTPVVAQLPEQQNVAEGAEQRWGNPKQHLDQLGLPAPIKKLLQQLAQATSD